MSKVVLSLSSQTLAPIQSAELIAAMSGRMGTVDFELAIDGHPVASKVFFINGAIGSDDGADKATSSVDLEAELAEGWAARRSGYDRYDRLDGESDEALVERTLGSALDKAIRGACGDISRDPRWRALLAERERREIDAELGAEGPRSSGPGSLRL